MTALDRMVKPLVGRQVAVEATAEMVVATVAAPAVAVVEAAGVKTNAFEPRLYTG